jgi:hypothetical protein
MLCFYATIKCKAYRVALVRMSVHMYVLQILWHQLLINYRADFFQTCTDDQARCVDDCKEKIFFLQPFFTRSMALF